MEVTTVYINKQDYEKEIRTGRDALTQAQWYCRMLHDFTPEAVREIDTGHEGNVGFMCFESITDAELWDRQR
jgi:hypothetical protein